MCVEVGVHVVLVCACMCVNDRKVHKRVKCAGDCQTLYMHLFTTCEYE